MLKQDQYGGRLAGLTAPIVPTLVFNGAQGTPSGSGTTTATHSNVPFGAPASSRLVVIAVSSLSSPVTTLVSATIGGVAADIHVNVTDGILSTALISAAVPSGNSGDVVITYSANVGTASLYRLNSYSLYALGSNTPMDTASDTTLSGADLSIDLDITGPMGLFIAHGRGGSSTTFTWANANEDSDVSSFGSSASGSGLTTETPRTITATTSNSPSTKTLIGASWA